MFHFPKASCTPEKQRATATLQNNYFWCSVALQKGTNNTCDTLLCACREASVYWPRMNRIPSGCCACLCSAVKMWLSRQQNIWGEVRLNKDTLLRTHTVLGSTGHNNASSVCVSDTQIFDWAPSLVSYWCLLHASCFHLSSPLPRSSLGCLQCQWCKTSQIWNATFDLQTAKCTVSHALLLFFLGWESFEKQHSSLIFTCSVSVR